MPSAVQNLLVPMGKVLAATLAVAATVWMVQPYAQPQASSNVSKQSKLVTQFCDYFLPLRICAYVKPFRRQVNDLQVVCFLGSLAVMMEAFCSL